MKKDLAEILGWVGKTSDFLRKSPGGQKKNERNQMIVLEWLFLTMSPVEIESWPLGLQGEINLFSYFIFIYSRLFVWISFHRDPIPEEIFHGSPIQLMGLILSIVGIISQGPLLEIAMCDVRSGSPSGAADFHQAVQPRAPEGAPLPDPEIAQAVLVPILEQPLMPDHTRRMELFDRLAVHFVGRHHEVSAFFSVLEKRMLLEKKIETALVHDGVNPINI